MKITAQARYALRILLDIAAHGGSGPRPIKEIAASQGISEMPSSIPSRAISLRPSGTRYSVFPPISKRKEIKMFYVL